jgi:hypothetical protein
LQVIHREILDKHCVKTWDLCLDIISDKAFWALAPHPSDQAQSSKATSAVLLNAKLLPRP